MADKPHIRRVLLLGPTAVGKTALSQHLHEKWNTPIISVDSRQCYRFLNIGTAKPECSFLASVPHLNLSVLHPSEKESVAKFNQRITPWVTQLEASSRLVCFAGGSTLYLQSLIQPIDALPQADEAYIQELEYEINQHGLASLYERLKAIDPYYATRMDGLNKQRILRALDVYHQTGKPFSSFHAQDTLSCPEDVVVIGLFRNREQLVQRINNRVDAMIENGLIDEVQGLIKMGLHRSLPGLNTVGYVEVFHYLEGKLTKSEMIEHIKINTRQYAKRQMTWFKRWSFIQWIDADQDEQTIMNIVLNTVEK